MKVLGVCGGNGVILHPFKKHLIANLEPRAIFHSKGEQQWGANFTQPIFKSLIELRSIVPNNILIDAIIGAPDCGHSSMLALSRGKKMTDPKKNDSLNIFIDCVRMYTPKVFLMENLPAIFKKMDKSWFESQFPNYHFIYIEKPVTYFGNSQTKRVRLVMIGVKGMYLEKLKNRIVRFELATHTLKTVKDLIGDLGKYDITTGHIRELDSKLISMYVSNKNRITVKKARRLWNSRFKGLKRWVVNRARMKNQPGIYRNLDNKTPLTATKGDRQFTPQGNPMTPRELARIQGVPDSFKIYIDPNNKQYWINKGRTTVAKTPPYEIGMWFYSCIRVG